MVRILISAKKSVRDLMLVSQNYTRLKVFLERIRVLIEGIVLPKLVG
jgi:hypothetical protein